MTETFEERHRQRKRKAEMELIVQEITPYIKSADRKNILEFGSGNGYQISYLKRLGNLIASDIYKSKQIDTNIKFVICDIRNTPFAEKSFNLIFSNHVLEHIPNITKAFSELKRIGSNDCIYAFTVPTNIWLLFSIPAQCYNALRRIFNKGLENREIKRKRRGQVHVKRWQKFLPVGHGWQKDFFNCLNSFKIKNWQTLFCEYGFTVIKKIPLLLYAPSEFPIIPTTRFLVRRGICSSAMFVLKKAI